jgi:pSer/pThr/pTyr-binding forkhead associated (FHA) protein
VADDEAATVISGAPGGAEAGDEDATQIVRPEANRPRFALRHEQPPGHSGTTTLKQDAYLIGRSPNSDLRLFSTTASREHARLTLRSGAWYLAPCEGKTVLVDGQGVHAEVRLIHKMRLQFGDDELLVLDQAAAVDAPASAATAAGASAGSGMRWVIVGAVAAAVVIAAVIVWMLSRG